MLPPQKCALEFELKTWGGKDSAHINSQVYTENIEGDKFKVMWSGIEGGAIVDTSLGKKLLYSGYFMVPWLTSLLTLFHLY